MATLTSRTLNFASALATRTSAAAMTSTPPPMHQPEIDATTGLRHRATEVTLDLRDKTTDRRYAATFRVVCAREDGTCPAGETPLEWLLLTTYPVATFADACLVLFGYACRWRIEEFHLAWKRGVCHVEDTQLRTRDRRIKWALLLAAVAVRTVRLTYLARTQPTRPATQELSATEIEAMRDLRPRRVLSPTAQLALAEAMLWIACLGGYTGTASGGPPGMITIGRGLRRVLEVAQAAHGRAARRAKGCAAKARRSAATDADAEVEK